ncbi:hypothetical protein D3C87_1116500 [compost metagenome]
MRIPQHQVGIGTHTNRAFAWIEVEDLRGVGGGEGDEILHRQTPGVNPLIPKHCHAIFDTRRTVGNLAEVIAPGGFLLGAEAAMVSRGGVQIAILQSVPQRLLMTPRTERRAHHVTGSGLPVRVLIDAVVEQQMPGEDFAINRLALAARISDFVEGFLGRNVHQIQRRADGFSNTNRPARRFTFNLRGPRQRMRLRPGDALGHQLALQVINQLAVFRVHGRHRAEFQAALETRHQRVVGGHDCVLVSHEMLEAVDPVMADQLGHFLTHLLAPPGDCDVEAIVGSRLFRPAAPLMKGFHQRLLRIGNHKIDDRCGAAGQTGRRAAIEIFAGHGAHER